MLITQQQREAIAVDAMRAGESPYWVAFFRDVFGVDGAIRRHLHPQEVPAYRRLDDFGQLMEQLADKRSTDTSKADAVEPLQMITIRTPRSVHASLVSEAAESNLAIQQLAISKLIVPVDDRFLPETQGKIRGRRPGTQGALARGNETLAPIDPPIG